MEALKEQSRAIHSRPHTPYKSLRDEDAEIRHTHNAFLLKSFFPFVMRFARFTVPVRRGNALAILALLLPDPIGALRLVRMNVLAWYSRGVPCASLWFIYQANAHTLIKISPCAALCAQPSVNPLMGRSGELKAQ